MRHGAVAVMLKYTAVTGFAVAEISLITSLFQAPHDHSWLKWLGAGLTGYGIAAVLAGARAALRFPGPARPAARPHVQTVQTVQASSPASLLIGALWGAHRLRPGPAESELHAALELGRLNGVEGGLARAFPAELPGVLADVEGAGDWYQRVLADATIRLDKAKIPAVLIEERPRGESVCGYLNLVIPRRYWQRALNVLADRDTFCLRRPDTILIQPPAGPSLHLRPDLSWLGAQFLSTDRLIAHAWRTRAGVLAPDPIDRLRILLGRALFQRRGLDLSQLMTVSDLMHPGVIAAAREEACREGWLRGFDDMLARAESAISHLDQGLLISLPVPAPG